MPIRKAGVRLVDDSRTFDAAELTEIWEWLDSLDALLSSAAHDLDDTAPPANQDTPARAPRELRTLAGEEDIYLG